MSRRPESTFWYRLGVLAAALAYVFVSINDQRFAPIDRPPIEVAR